MSAFSEHTNFNKTQHKSTLFIVSFVLVLFFFLSGKLYSQCTAVIGANISPIEGCEILTVQFNDLSTGPVLSRIWDFGDGSPTSTSSGPIHSFSAGLLGDTTYIITLNTQCISGPPSVAYDTVLVRKKPSVNFSSDKIILCALTDSACFTNLSTFGPGYTCLWNFGDFTTSNQFEPCHIYTTGGVYTVQLTVTNTYGCANSVTFTNYITVIPAPTLDFNLSSFLGCSPMAVTFTNITDTISTSFSSWQWNFGDGSPPINAFNPPAHTFLLPGTYFIVLSATNSLGCSNSTTKAIVVRTTPTSVFSALSPVCVGSNSILTYTGIAGAGATYSWNFAGGIASPGSGSGPHNVFWNSSGTMNVNLVVTDSGCTSGTTVPVIVNPLPVVTLTVSPNDTVCQGDAVTFTATPSTLLNYSFYQNGALVQNSSSNIFVPATINSGDSIYVLGTNSFGCTSLGGNAIDLFVNPLPAVTLSSGSLTGCSGDSIAFTASPAGYDNYTFYQGFLVLQNSSSNVYSTTNWINGDSIHVTATNNGCTGAASNFIAPVISQPLPTPQVNCGTSTNTSIEFTWLPVAGATGYLVSVNGGPFVSPSSGASGTTELITGLTAGSSSTILVIALGSAPCGNSDTSAIQTCFALNCSAITFTMNPLITVCSGNNVTLDLTGFSIASPFVSWNGGASVPYSSFTFTPSSDTTISVTVSDPLQPGCVPVTNYFIIQVTPSPTAVLSISPSTDTLCQGVPATFTASPAGYADYSFYDGVTLLQSSNNPNYIVPNVPGTFSINVVTTYLGCQFTTNTLPLTVLPSPPIALSSSPASGTICSSDTVVFTASPAGYSNYTFYNGTTVLQSSPSNTFINSSFIIGSGNNITVVATNSNGCNSASSNILNFTVLSPPPISLTCSDADMVICEGDLVTYTAAPAGMALYQFFDGTTLLQSSGSNIYSTNGLLPGSSLTVIGTNASGCNSLASNSLSINVKPLPNSYISASDSTICSGTSVTLTANQSPVIPGTTFIWSTGSISTAPTYSPTVNTNYILYSSLNGCSGIPDTISILVDNTPPPTATAGGTTTICFGDSITLSGSGGTTIFWTPISGLSNDTINNPTASPSVTTIYTLNTYNLYCMSTASVTITVDLCLDDITGPIPTGITPNGDGTNDYFIIPNVDYFTKNSLTIYNRWGNVIFKAAPYANDWNGVSLNGGDLPDAVYYYILDLGNENKPYTGFILIQR